MKSQTLKLICKTIFFLGLANFAVFVAVALRLGGDAVNGKVEDGRYFVSSHGKDTEVSRETYLYSRTHARSVWITHPLALLAAFAAARIDKAEEKRSAESSQK
jgi:hypothetical protein